MCECQINMTDDYGFCVTLKDINPIARKQHKCGECGKIINKGEKYKTETILFEGNISTHKTCLDCLSIRDNLFCSFEFGDILETLRDEIFHGGLVPESCIRELTPAARAKVCELIENQWEDEE